EATRRAAPAKALADDDAMAADRAVRMARSAGDDLAAVPAEERAASDVARLDAPFDSAVVFNHAESDAACAEAARLANADLNAPTAEMIDPGPIARPPASAGDFAETAALADVAPRVSAAAPDREEIAAAVEAAPRAATRAPSAPAAEMRVPVPGTPRIAEADLATAAIREWAADELRASTDALEWAESRLTSAAPARKADRPPDAPESHLI